MSLPMLSGTVDNRDQIIAELEEEVRILRAENKAAQEDLQRVKRENSRSVGALRTQLLPLFQALQVLFGELEKFDLPEEAASNRQPVNASVWNMWKERLGTSTAKVIDALLVQGDLNTQQLAIATGLHRVTIRGLICKMNKAGLLNKNGGRFSLKALG